MTEMCNVNRMYVITAPNLLTVDIKYYQYLLIVKCKYCSMVSYTLGTSHKATARSAGRHMDES